MTENVEKWSYLPIFFRSGSIVMEAQVKMLSSAIHYDKIVQKSSRRPLTVNPFITALCLHEKHSTVAERLRPYSRYHIPEDDKANSIVENDPRIEKTDPNDGKVSTVDEANDRV